jgi:hypothetical protein
MIRYAPQKESRMGNRLEAAVLGQARGENRSSGSECIEEVKGWVPWREACT